MNKIKVGNLVCWRISGHYGIITDISNKYVKIYWYNKNVNDFYNKIVTSHRNDLVGMLIVISE